MNAKDPEEMKDETPQDGVKAEVDVVQDIIDDAIDIESSKETKKTEQKTKAKDTYRSLKQSKSRCTSAESAEEVFGVRKINVDVQDPISRVCRESMRQDSFTERDIEGTVTYKSKFGSTYTMPIDSWNDDVSPIRTSIRVFQALYGDVDAELVKAEGSETMLS
jgi:hypothetical protein